ncbi:trypsin-like peptidase domain-containing protein [Candidatus Babeliales bacterium]|nr:trypsin-like peptidase domain-containing protein [Candidatus Babeliales bacterium]
MKKIHVVCGAITFLLLCAFGYVGYVALSDYSQMRQMLQTLQEHVGHSSENSISGNLPKNGNEDPCNTAISSQLWAKLQKSLQNTVVQLHVTNIEKNVLQPYRVPKTGACTGSGFIISDEGEIVTNAHVVTGATSVMVQMPAFGKHQFEVDLIGIMPEKDFALVKFRPDDIQTIINMLGKMPKLPLGDSDSVVRSQEVLALGYPLGQQSLKSTTGVISGRESGLIQMSAPINPGSSGGPLLNCLGEVIGINTCYIQNAQNVNYIIGINDLKIFLKHLRAGGLVRKPYIGVYQAMATEDLVKSLGNPMPGGTYVVEVLCDSPLLGQLQPGDMIYNINGVDVDLYGDLSVPWSEDKISTAEYISRLEVGGPVKLVVYRKGKKINMECMFERKKLAPVRLVYAEYEELPYETFGGFVVMPLMLNHLSQLGGAAPMLSKYADEKNHNEPALIVTHVHPDSPAYKERLRITGSVLKMVNGKPVKTLDDLKAALLSSDDIVTLETTDNILVALAKEKICKAEPALAQKYNYPVTETMKEMIQRHETKKAKKEAAQQKKKQTVKK